MKNKALSAFASVVVFVAVVGGFTLLNKQDTSSTNSTTATPTVVASAIAFSSDNKTVKYDGKEGETALATMQSLTAVQTEDSAYGKMVVSINGASSEKNKTYWAFYVNDTYANEGAETYKAKVGDKIKWQLEEIKL